MAIGEVTLPLLTAFQRVIDLLDDPKNIPILAPIIQREIVHRLLVSDQGMHLRQMTLAGSQSHEYTDPIVIVIAPSKDAWHRSFHPE